MSQTCAMIFAPKFSRFVPPGFVFCCQAASNGLPANLPEVLSGQMNVHNPATLRIFSIPGIPFQAKADSLPIQDEPEGWL
jgi:hypothetical protein